MDDIWLSLIIQVATNSVVIVIALVVVKGRIQHSFDKRLLKYNHDFDKKLSEMNHAMANIQFLSSALYKRREQAIIEFDGGVRDFLGSCSDFVHSEPAPSEIIGKWNDIRNSFIAIQKAMFLGRLVFDDETRTACEALFKILSGLNTTVRPIVAFSAHASNVRFSDDEHSEKYDMKVSPDKYRDKVLEATAFINVITEKTGLLIQWEVVAQKALKSCRVE